MPKLKSKKTLVKRLKITKGGFLIRKKIGLKHLMATKRTNQRLRARKLANVRSKGYIKKFKKLLGKQGKRL